MVAYSIISLFKNKNLKKSILLVLMATLMALSALSFRFKT